MDQFCASMMCRVLKVSKAGYYAWRDRGPSRRTRADERLLSQIKTELIYRGNWATREQARAAVYEYIETRYNRKRLHSTLGYLSPEEFEEQDRRSHRQAA